MTASIEGADLRGQKITVLRGGIDSFPADIVTDTAASADVLIPPNDGTAAVTHTLTVMLNGALVVPTVSTTVVVSADEEPDDPYNPLDDVELTPSSLSLAVGETKTLTATLAPSNTTSKDITAKWQSGNAAVATVTEVKNTGITRTATVTGVSKGSARVTIWIGDIIKECVVTVTDAPFTPPTPTGINFVLPNQTLQVGQTKPLAWNLVPTGATATVTLTSSNPAVVTVSPSTTTGLTATLTGLTPGSAIITASTDNGKTTTCTVQVTGEAGVTGTINRVALSTQNLAAGRPFDIQVSLASVPNTVRIDVLRPDWLTDSLTARIEGLTAWVSYTPPQEGTYTITATAYNSSGVPTGSGTQSFVVTSGGRSGHGSGGGGGCSAAGIGLLALALVPVVWKIKKSK
ncbi:MAG: Ig-like domain-containing protein [Synergistaceae bacterium]|nr:Ig-like domain-containing protein [Synergistaceae bacterium]